MAVFNSDLVLAGQQTFSIPPGTVCPVVGKITIASNTSIATNDTFPMFSMPGPGSHIINGWIQFPALDGGSGLTMTLKDAGSITFITASTTGQAGGMVQLLTSTSAASIGNAVTYTTPTGILMTAAHQATNTSGATALVIYFAFEITND